MLFVGTVTDLRSAFHAPFRALAAFAAKRFLCDSRPNCSGRALLCERPALGYAVEIQTGKAARNGNSCRWDLRDQRGFATDAMLARIGNQLLRIGIARRIPGQVPLIRPGQVRCVDW
jgi:hypothetical protein